MITKITNANAELYYAPRFAQITAAFKDAGSDIEIKSLEDYFLHLTDIAQLDVGAKNMPEAFLLVLPADEEIFEINANTRAINVPTFVKRNGIGVYGDHRAEMIVMTIDRYFDHEDFLNDKFVINWNFTPSGAKLPMYEENQAAAAFAPNEELNPGLITFGFIITKDMTPSKGVLNFSVTIYDEKSDEIVYSFNTLPVSVNINDTLTLTNPKIIKNDTANYVGRLVNSVYTDNTISPVGKPEWKSGVLGEDGKFSGLDAKAYFSPNEDLQNQYNKGALLKAYAVADPATAGVYYKWTFSPVDGTVETARDFFTRNLASDYIEISLPEEDNGAIFFKKNESDQIDLEHPLTWADAKAIADAADDSDDRPFLNIKVGKLLTAPADENADDSQFNQNKMACAVVDDTLNITSLEELRVFESTDENQGSAKWIGIDIDTGLDSIIGALWGSYALTDVDVGDAESVGLGAGHIIFWAKAEDLMSSARTITISADGYKPTTFKVRYLGVNPDFVGSNSLLEIETAIDEAKFFVCGSSLNALSAGNYQVVAQARIGAGEKYEKVLESAPLKVNTDYFLKVNDEIDKLNPLQNEDAQAARDNGDELYVLVSAARNSEPVESSVLVVPAALQPQVSLSVASEYTFSDAVQKDPAWEGTDYVYIDANNIPVIEATVSIDSDDARDSKGAFAAQLVEANSEKLTLASIEEGIADESLVFKALPADGKFIFQSESIEEHEYMVRVVNRRNGTYSVSDEDNPDKIETSFVAPVMNVVSVAGAVWDAKDGNGNDNPRPAQGFVTVIDGGERPNGTLINLQLQNRHPRWTFNLIDENVIDGNIYKLEDLAVNYYLEEVEYDSTTGEITPRALPADGEEQAINPETGAPYEYNGESDLRQITDKLENGTLFFNITGDPGVYRIKAVSTYHGTVCTSYSDIFGLMSY